jgi:transcriptional regulator with XRE-family HTH domain
MGVKRDTAALRRLGARVRKLRLERDLSQESLAFDAGMHTNHLSSIERGEANPSFLVLVALAKVLRVTVGDIVE